MVKAMVIGCPGAGKSTFARKLSAGLNLPLYHLDMIWHKPDKTNISKEEFDIRLYEIVKKDRWIIDGNYNRTLEVRMRECDTVFLMDYPLQVCLSGAKARIGKKREDLPWIESELDEEFRQQILDFPKSGLPRIYGLLDKYKKEKNIVIFHTREESKNYLNMMFNKNKQLDKKKGVMMAFDYKKEYKEFYMPKNKPGIIDIPKMNYIAVRGKGNPNDENGEYKKSIGLLYAIAFTIKMSYKGTHQIEGYFQYVVPPLEGFWWQEGNSEGIDYNNKEEMQFISIIRLPDFVAKEEFDWAIKEASEKKKQDFSKVEFLTYEEGTCVQCMHIGSYDDEPATIEMMHRYAEENGYETDITDTRYHHEIYLSDPRRCQADKLRTVVRHPIKRKK